jgi:hypothetical protein
LPQPTESRYLRTAQVAELLHVSPKTVSRWAQEGRLPFFVPWAATDATPTPRSGPCWKPCPSYPQSANRPPHLTAPAPLLSMARWPFGILRSIGVVSDPGTADFLRARDNPGDRTTWANARKPLLTCAIGRPWLAALIRGFPVVRGPSAAPLGSWGDAAEAHCTGRSEPVLYRRIVFAAATLSLPRQRMPRQSSTMGSLGTAWAARRNSCPRPGSKAVGDRRLASG